MHVTLPTDLATSLRSGKSLEYNASNCESGQVELNALTSLHLVEIFVDSMETPFEPCSPPTEDDIYEHNPSDWDPRCSEGYYAIQAVPLVARSTRHASSPVGMLLWYPLYNQYGQWDSEHSNALRFGASTWNNIVANPARFLDAKWRWNEEEDIFNWVTPWQDKQFDFRTGDTPVVSNDLGSIIAT